MKLSIIIPVYNEAATITEVLKQVSSLSQEKEIIVVDDWSGDGTRHILEGIALPELRVIFHDRNRGKGAAIRTGLRMATGDAVMIQDADLEYDPTECVALLRPIEQGQAAVVYGSRFKGGGEFLLKSRLANRFLTALTNLIFGTRLTDMETCYKMMRIDVARSLRIKSSGFEVEPEITAKILKRGHRIWEVPITYHGRRSSEGKKIGWKDGLKAIAALLRYRFRE
ncbi:MAG: glycosyltransferase family 2 protein [bacterium]